MRAKLKLLRGSHAGKVIEVKREKFLIGRADSCQLRPNHDAISRRHCQFTVYADKVTVQDLGSRNGTYLNGEKLAAEKPLATGDELRLGPLKFEVIITDDQGNVQQAPAVDELAADPVGTGSDDSGLIGQWLEEADEKARPKPGSSQETRQFQLDETDWQLADETAKDTDQTDTKSFLRKGKKKEPGKLPVKKQDAETANSREAAAETLKKLFNRGAS